MTQPTAYQNLVSPRSRRLRTIGVLLLVSIVLMALYGVRSVMPNLRAASQQYNAKFFSTQNAAALKPTRHQRRAMQIQLLFADAYWLICGLLALSAVIVAWLDFREVSRNYLVQRRSLFLDSANRVAPSEEISE